MSQIDKKLIVIVDDDEDDCYLLQISVQKTHPDYKVLSITDSFRVIERLEALQQLPHLILLDLHMPINGIDVLNQIKALPRYNAVRIAVISSSTDPNLLAAASRMGVTSVVEKPNNLDSILTTLARLLD